MSTHQTFDVIIIGGGHAGIEAAYAAAKLGSRTLLITLDLTKIGLMPCNPSIGGIGKGHITYEISALGGLMPKLCTKTYLQARMLNTRKGPAVQGLRLQIDKVAYSKLSQEILAQQKNLTLLGAAVDDVLLDENQHVAGIRTSEGTEYHAPTVVITAGTFLNGKIFVGKQTHAGGRTGEKAVSALSTFLQNLNLQMGRLKTGTPPRLLKSSLDFSKMEQQKVEPLSYLFEFDPHPANNTHNCHITHTNEKTHEIIQHNMHHSGVYNGDIVGQGPRYCPSIEVKVHRFPDKTSHHIFVEPEDASHHEVYPSGLSTALPLEVQEAYITSIVGFENAIITQPGYSVEYDFIMPNQLHPTLELKKVPGLFLAGQINGTTGYEEAGGQGMIAGINAHQKAHGKPAFILDRTESYIGVMIDDLTSMGIDEPYRMFTSRAERRLLLRQDNVFLRLMPRAYELGLIEDELYQAFKRERDAINKTLEQLRTNYRETDLMREFGQELCTPAQLETATGIALSERAALTVHAEIRYAPYLEREKQEVARMEKYRQISLPKSICYKDVPGLSKELQEKLGNHRPETIAHASLIPGMTPAAISLLIFKARDASR